MSQGEVSGGGLRGRFQGEVSKGGLRGRPQGEVSGGVSGGGLLGRSQEEVSGGGFRWRSNEECFLINIMLLVFFQPLPSFLPFFELKISGSYILLFRFSWFFR